MKRTISILLLAIVICVFYLCGCGSTMLSESDLLAGIPEEIKTIYIDDIPRLLDVTNMEIEKRKTNDETDEVHCTLTLSDGTYETTASYILTYVFYDEGGWILDYWDVLDFHTNVIAAPERESMDAEIKHYYFDQIIFVNQYFSRDTQTCDTVYTVTYQCDNYAYDGNVFLRSNFTPNTYGGSWEHELIYAENFKLNIDGNWAGTPEDINGTRMRSTAFEIDIQSTDMFLSEGSVYFSATEYITSNSSKEYSVYEREDSSAYISPTNNDDKYAALTFSFMVYVGKSDYSVYVKPYEFTVYASGHGGTISGSLHRGYHISVSENSFGWPQYHRVAG